MTQPTINSFWTDSYASTGRILCVLDWKNLEDGRIRIQCRQLDLTPGYTFVFYSSWEGFHQDFVQIPNPENASNYYEYLGWVSDPDPTSM